MTVYDHATQTHEFVNWEDCPRYTKLSLSSLLDLKDSLPNKSRIRCLADIELSYEESTTLKQMFVNKHNLREFILEESDAVTAAISETQTAVNVDVINTTDVTSVNELMIQMLKDISVEAIDNEKLIEIYRTIK